MRQITESDYAVYLDGDLMEIFDGIFGGIYIEILAVDSLETGMLMHVHLDGTDWYNSSSYANRPGSSGGGWMKQPDVTDAGRFESMDRRGLRLYRTDEEFEAWSAKLAKIANEEDKGTRHEYFVIDNINEAFAYAKQALFDRGVLTSEDAANGP